MLCNGINMINNCNSWEESIRLAAKPLLDNEYINSNYIEAIINNVKNNGPYIVVAPKIALPHARSEEGVKKTGFCIAKLDTPIMYPDNKEVSLLICLAAKDSSDHIDILTYLSEFLTDDERMEKALLCNSLEELKGVFSDISN